MRVLLVTPAETGERFVDGAGYAPFAQLAMVSVASATPPEHEIRLLDEHVESVDDAPEADVVGITIYTAVAPHGYDLARRFRERGAFVVLGGPHASALPHEATLHADAVVVGDAEDTWPQLLEDLSRGRVRRIYESSYRPLDDLKPPRLDLLKPGAYPTVSIAHATRGCPFCCEFCSVPGASGARYRRRPVRAIVDEVERHTGQLTIFWDDNLTADPEFAHALFTELKPLRKQWIGQATTLFARDRELVKLAGRAGCIGLFLGVESFSAASLREVRKGFNKVEKYRDTIARFHDAGIGIDAGIMFGFDHDDESIFARTVEAAREIRIDAISFNILTPFPGTEMYQRFRREGRLLTGDWSEYHPNRGVVFRPRLMSPRRLAEGHRWAARTFYSRWKILGRLLRGPKRVGVVTTSWFLNWHFRRVVEGLVPLDSLDLLKDLETGTAAAPGPAYAGAVDQLPATPTVPAE